MTGEQKLRLMKALTELEAALNDTAQSDGGRTCMRPSVSYDDLDDAFRLRIEVMSGREMLVAGMG